MNRILFACLFAATIGQPAYAETDAAIQARLSDVFGVQAASVSNGNAKIVLFEDKDGNSLRNQRIYCAAAGLNTVQIVRNINYIKAHRNISTAPASTFVDCADVERQIKSEETEDAKRRTTYNSEKRLINVIKADPLVQDARLYDGVLEIIYVPQERTQPPPPSPCQYGSEIKRVWVYYTKLNDGYSDMIACGG